MSPLQREDLAELSGAEYPALGVRVWGVLWRAEWFKARHRLAFWVTLGFFTFIHLMEAGDSFFDARSNPERTHALPGAWADVFSDNSVLVLFFATIALIMLASSEFTWRTARQNVIDGVSKSQWFWGKAMLLPMLGLIFVLVKLSISGGAALLGTDLSTTDGILPLSVVAASGGLMLAFFSLGGLALLISTTVRNSGPAMAVWFFWVAMGEQLLPSLVGRFAPAASPAFALLPFNAAQQVMNFASYDAPTLQRLVAAREAAGEAAPELPNLAFLLGVNAGWAVLFVAVAFLVFKGRDL